MQRHPPSDWARPGARESVLTFDGPLKQTFTPRGRLEVAGADGTFPPATATPDGHDTLVLTVPDVPAPTAARSAGSDAPIASLFDPYGLPVAPFGTK